MLPFKYFFIFLRFFIHFQLVLLHDQINVGTVLFSKKDSEKKCWNDERIALLRARLIYQDILPKTTLIDVKSDEFLNALIQYFHLAISKVKRLADGPTQQINLAAMCDVLGGYFRSILIPLTKRAFYSGKINFDTTQDVLKFYDSIKLFLHTDGQNWAPPSDANLNRFIRGSGPSSPKTNSGDSCEKLTFGDNNGFIYIPIPYFDTKKAPSAIAIPFKENPLRNLDHINAINCLSDFFSTAKNCLREKNASRENINTFKRDFEKFLDAEVFPHLTDEKIYGAFGGVFRIKNEITRKNVEKRKNAEKKIRNADSIKTNETESSADEFGNDLQDDDDKAPIIVLVCLCVVTALWLCITLYYCAKNRKIKIQKSSMTDNSVIDDQSVKNRNSSVIKIPEERRRSSVTNSSNVVKTTEENSEKPEAKKIAFVDDDSDHQKRKKCHTCSHISQQISPKFCPKCKRKHCRCIKNIWSTLSKYTITYPRIFPRKNAAILDKQFPNKSELSPKAQAHFLVQMASVIQKPPPGSVKSAPVTAGKNIWQSENPSRNATTVTEQCADEKIFVFGYDFETSSSDDSSFTDESSSDTINF